VDQLQFLWNSSVVFLKSKKYTPEIIPKNNVV
jgi:hypothetical protein